LARKKEFQSLSQGQRDLIIQILETQRLLSTELTDSIKSSEAKIAARLSAQDAQLDESARQHDLQIAILREEEFNVCKRRLLKALAFPEINERRNMIEGRVDDFGNTYEWIFNATHTGRTWPVASPPSSVVSEKSVGRDVEEETLLDFDEEGQAVSEVTISTLEKEASPAAEQDDDNDLGHGPKSDLPLASPVDNKQTTADVYADKDCGDIEPGGASNTIDSSSFKADDIQQPGEAQNTSPSEAAPFNFEVSEDRIEPIPRESPPTHAFVNWLESETDLFWISGKPGSGKSTLMDYIYHNIQPEKIGSDLLGAWAGSHSVVILTFWFFRPASTPLLRTLHGFWRSLCFQILDSDPNLAKTIREDKDSTAPSTLRSCLLPDGSSAESWTDNELRLWFWYMIEHSNMRYCLLIDGLDEIESSRELLLNTVLSMSSRSNKLKVCCACRPENPFQSILKQHPNLHLQDFNHGDIEEDCKRRLKGTCAEKFADQIAHRAEGVFLWAHLISEDLARAAKEGESEEDLDLRLKECPDEMTKLFKYMLLRQDKLYAKRPKPYLRLVDFASSIKRQTSLLELLVATLPPARSPKWSELSGKFDVGFLSYLEEQLNGLGPRIEATCTGLVQCLAPIKAHRYWTALKSDPTFPRLDDAVETPVVFIHRSVHDFLREDEDGVAYYQRFNLTDDEAASMLMAGAASPLFFSNEKLRFKFRPFLMHYAESLSKDGWDTKTIAVVDAFFKQLELRCSPTQEDMKISYPSLYAVSLDLSLYENLTMGFASMHTLDTYVQTKILEADPTRRHFLAAHALCTYLRGFWNRYRGEMVTTLSPYVDVLQVYKNIYSRDGGEEGTILDVVSTCPLIDHVVAARVADLPGWRDHELDYLRLPSGLLDQYAGTELDFGFVEGWILEYGGIDTTLPTLDDDCAYMKEVFENITVAVFQIRPQDILQADIFPLKIVRWSPAGTKRFLPINEAVQQKFRRSHSHRSWDILRQEFNAALVEGLNSPPNDMTEKELEEIKTRNSGYLTVDEDNKLKIKANGPFTLDRILDFWVEDFDRPLFSTGVGTPLPMKEPADTNLLFILRDEDDKRDEGVDAGWSTSRPITPLRDLTPLRSSTPLRELSQRFKTSPRAGGAGDGG
jgi:NACHT domain